MFKAVTASCGYRLFFDYCVLILDQKLIQLFSFILYQNLSLLYSTKRAKFRPQSTAHVDRLTRQAHAHEDDLLHYDTLHTTEDSLAQCASHERYRCDENAEEIPIGLPDCILSEMERAIGITNSS